MNMLAVVGCTSLTLLVAVRFVVADESRIIAAHVVATSGQAAPGVTGATLISFSCDETWSLNSASAPCIADNGFVVFNGIAGPTVVTGRTGQGLWAEINGQCVLLGMQPSNNYQTPTAPITSLALPLGSLPAWNGRLTALGQVWSRFDSLMLVEFSGGTVRSPLPANSRLPALGGTYPGDFVVYRVVAFGVDRRGLISVDFDYVDPVFSHLRRCAVRDISSPQSVLVSDQQAPGFDGDAPVWLNPLLLVANSDHIVLAGLASNVNAIWQSEPAGVGLLVRGGQIMPGWVSNNGFVNGAYGARGTISLNTSGLVVFSGRVNTSSGPRDGVWFGTPALVMPAVARGEPARLAGEGCTIGPPRQPRVNDWNEITFLANAASDDGTVSSAIWSGGVAEWSPIARVGAVSTDQATFATVASAGSPRINNLGQIAFVASERDANGRTTNGIWVQDPVAGLRRVAAEGDRLMTESGLSTAITSIAFAGDEMGDARQSGLNNSGTLVFAATTEDSAGVFTVDLNRLFCRADLNRDGVLDISDIFRFLDLYFSGSPRGDFDGSGTLSASDFYRYIDLFVGGC